MANGGGVTIKINGDNSGFDKTIESTSKKVRAAAKELGTEYENGGEKAEEALKDVEKAQDEAAKNGEEAAESAKKSNEKVVDDSEDAAEKVSRYWGEALTSASNSAEENSSKIRKAFSIAATGVKGSISAISTAVKGISIAYSAIAAIWSAVGLKSVQYNADMEQLETSFKVMTGSAEKATETINKLKALGAATPFSTQQLAETTQLLMQYGFTADEAIERLEMLGDIAQGNADSMTSIATGYAQMSSAGKVSLEDVKQMINGGFNPLQEISERTGESMASLYDRISKGTMAVDEITESMRAATSEGGKFFGSMAEQSQTVSGLLSTLQDELQALGGSIFEPMSDKLRTELLPRALEIVQEMSDAYARGGSDGLVSYISNALPKLLNEAVEMLTNLAGKIKEKLPTIVKKLMAAMPETLNVLLNDLLPTLVDSVFDIVAVMSEELTARLPELAPVVLKGVWNLIKSVVKGAWNVLNSSMSGLETALKKWGLMGSSAAEIFERSWDKIDTSQYKTVDVTIGGTVSVEDYQAKIDAALLEIRTALQNIPGLTEDQRAAIEKAILLGTGLDLLKDALTGYGVSDEDTAALVATINTAQETIDTTLVGLGLSDEAIENIKTVADEGGDVQAAIEAYGVDSATAQAAAKTIDTAMDTVETAALDIGFDPATVAKLRTASLGGKRQVSSALSLMGISESDIAPVLNSYDTVSGSLTARVDGIYDYIYDMFTDGKPESDQDVINAKNAVQAIVSDAYARLDEWYASEVQRLKDEGYAGDEFEAEMAKIDATYQELADGIEENATAMTNTVDGMVGQSTEYCKGAMENMQLYSNALKDVISQIDILTEKDMDVVSSRRTLVKQGAVTDVEHQMEAIALTAAEYAQKIEDADKAAAEALDKAAVDYANDPEAYAAAEKEILEQRAAAYEAAGEWYDSEMQAIATGIAKANDEVWDAINEYNAEQEDLTLVDALRQAMVAAMGEYDRDGSFDFDTWLAGLIGDGMDMNKVAELLDIDPDALPEILKNAILNAGDGRETWDEAVLGYMDGVETDFAKALEGANLEPVQAAFKASVENGTVKGVNNVDWTKPEAVLEQMLAGSLKTGAQDAADEAEPEITEAMEGAVSGAGDALDVSADAKQSGKNTAKGFAAGINSERSTVVAAIKRMAKAAMNELDERLLISSPSRATKQSGMYFAQGFALGISEEEKTALNAAQRLADGALGTLDGIGGRITLAQQTGAGGYAAAFQSMLQSLTLSTESEQPIQLFINKRLVGEAMRGTTRASQNAFNTALAKGVGK